MSALAFHHIVSQRAASSLPQLGSGLTFPGRFFFHRSERRPFNVRRLASAQPVDHAFHNPIDPDPNHNKNLRSLRRITNAAKEFRGVRTAYREFGNVIRG